MVRKNQQHTDGAIVNDEIVNWITRKHFGNLCLCFAERNEHGWVLPDWLDQWGEKLGYWPDVPKHPLFKEINA
jgi:hypothetical protein